MAFQRFLHGGHHGHNDSSSASLMHLIQGEDWKLATMECRMNPKEAAMWSTQPGFFDGIHDARILPIHQACALQPPPEVIEALIECHPAGIRSKESGFDRLPLHVACQTSAGADIIRVLLSYNGEASRTKDCLGRLPLHYACSHRATPEVISLLLDSFPAAAGVEDKNGWIALHVACRFAADPDVVRQLLEILPGATMIKTLKGSTALSLAKKVKDGSTDEIIKVLEEAMKDDIDMNPTGSDVLPRKSGYATTA
uniref:Uncharacterized protein n=2 Tax=Helicotheca tamesis TaxID=374047 RepID=A0A7S2ICF1_9STRA